jgi:hypothetical protein
VEVSLWSKVTLGFSSTLSDEAEESDVDLELGMAGQRDRHQHQIFMLHCLTKKRRKQTWSWAWLDNEVGTNIKSSWLCHFLTLWSSI